MKNSGYQVIELLTLKVDIAALQETRLAESGSLKEKDCTFGATKCPTSRSFLTLANPSCTCCSGKADWAGLATCAALKTVGSPRIFYMANLHLAKDPKVALNFYITMSANATWKLWTSIQRSRRAPQQTSSYAACSRNSWRQVRRGSLTWQKSGESGGRHAHRPSTNYICSLCSRDCHSRIGLTSHRRCCSSRCTTSPRAQYPWSTNDRRRPSTTSETKCGIGFSSYQVISFSE